MKINALQSCVVLTCLTFLFHARPETQDSKPASAKSVEDLAFFAGSWSCKKGGALVEEHWTKPAGKTLIGMGRTVGNGVTVEFEYLRIEERKDGIVYIAQPGGQAPTEFKLTNSENGEFVFE